jgi:hypothetical protein
MLQVPRCNGFFTAVASVPADGIYTIRIEREGCYRTKTQERTTGDPLNISVSDLLDSYTQRVQVNDPNGEKIWEEIVEVV